jgi:hypothetical protein
MAVGFYKKLISPIPTLMSTEDVTRVTELLSNQITDGRKLPCNMKLLLKKFKMLSFL